MTYLKGTESTAKSPSTWTVVDFSFIALFSAKLHFVCGFSKGVENVMPANIFRI